MKRTTTKRKVMLTIWVTPESETYFSERRIPVKRSYGDIVDELVTRDLRREATAKRRLERQNKTVVSE